MKEHKLELLAPAGDMEKLRTAILYGADAVYVGVPGLSLRTRASEMDFGQIKTGTAYAHKHGVKVYAALNIFPQNDDFILIRETIPHLADCKVDGIIASDPGIIALIQKMAPKMKIHLSTQANTTNIEAARFWASQGISRIVLARELSLTEIAQIAQNIKKTEIEIFAHGAMCMAYSGRCMLSTYMTGRQSNRGECTHPCRWEYQLKEANREEPLIIDEDEHGTYIFNSRDLCLIEHLPLIIESQVSSIKIEGRMKSSYYVATVTKIYRQAIDTYYKNPDKYKFDPQWLAELNNVSNRGYTTGFIISKPVEQDYNYASSAYNKKYDFVGVVDKYSNKTITIAVRNHILATDELEIVLPGEDKPVIIPAKHIMNARGELIDAAHNANIIYAMIEKKVPEGAIIRRKVRK